MIISEKVAQYKIEKSESGYFIIMYKIPRYGFWCKVENAEFKTALKKHRFFTAFKEGLKSIKILKKWTI